MKSEKLFRVLEKNNIKIVDDVSTDFIYAIGDNKFAVFEKLNHKECKLVFTGELYPVRKMLKEALEVIEVMNT